MSVGNLETIIACQNDLLLALDARDVASMESASAALQVAVNAAKSTDTWQNHAEAKAKIDYALKQSDAARTRVNFLSDWTRQKIEKLAELRGVAHSGPYKNRKNPQL
jgi:hypothetical protein